MGLWSLTSSRSIHWNLRSSTLYIMLLSSTVDFVVKYLLVGTSSFVSISIWKLLSLDEGVMGVGLFIFHPDFLLLDTLVNPS